MTKMYKLNSMPFAQCHVEIERDDKTNNLVRISLVSYRSEVIRIYPDDGCLFKAELVKCAVDYSSTTARHVNRFTTEFFGKNLYFEFKKFDFEHPVPLVMDEYFRAIVNALQYYENNGKRFRY